MVKVFLLSVLVVCCSIANAQELPNADQETLEDPETLHKPVECYSAESIVKLTEEKGLILFWQGPNLKDNYPDNTIVVMLDPNANGWVVFEMTLQVACILGYGQSFWLFDQLYMFLDPLQETD